MSLSPSVIDAMIASGCTAEQLGAAVKAAAAEDDVALAAKRAKAAEKKRRQRANAPGTNGDKVGQAGTDGDNPSPKKETSPAPLKEKTTPSITEPNGSSKTRASRLPADWVLPVEWRADAIKAGLPQDRIDLEAEKMRDWSISSPNGAKREWRPAWRNWVKGAVDKLPRGSPAFARTERPDHFANYTRELIDGQDRSHGSDSRNWDDVEGVPILAIDYERR